MVIRLFDPGRAGFTCGEAVGLSVRAISCIVACVPAGRPVAISNLRIPGCCRLAVVPWAVAVSVAEGTGGGRRTRSMAPNPTDRMAPHRPRPLPLPTAAAARTLASRRTQSNPIQSARTRHVTLIHGPPCQPRKL